MYKIYKEKLELYKYLCINYVFKRIKLKFYNYTIEFQKFLVFFPKY